MAKSSGVWTLLTATGYIILDVHSNNDKHITVTREIYRPINSSKLPNIC